MSEVKSYEDKDGNLVFTSAYLKARNTCCKSACVHCPFGYTLKKLGLQFEDWDPSREGEARSYLADAGRGDFDFAPFIPDNAKFISIKGKTCGLLVKNHIVVKGVFLARHFQNQGLDKDIIESYFFS